MQVSAVEKALDRIHTAKASLAVMSSVRNVASFRREWSNYIIALSSVFNILQQGSKGTPQSEKWMAKHIHLRRTDPLLRYLHHARNADVHGIRAITRQKSGRVVIESGDGPIASIEDFDGRQGRYSPMREPQRLDLATNMKVFPAQPELQPVYDRGVRYDPPKNHLGHPLEVETIGSVAKCAFPYFEQLLTDAIELSRASPEEKVP